jgi:hypothetical protein
MTRFTYLMVEVVITSETSANIYQTTRRNIPEDSDIHNCLRENLKSHHSNSTFLLHKLLRNLRSAELFTRFPTVIFLHGVDPSLPLPMNLPRAIIKKWDGLLCVLLSALSKGKE